MVKSYKSFLMITGGLCVLLAACAPSSSPVHVGEAIMQGAPVEGTRVAEVGDRFLLPNDKIAGKESALIQTRSVVSQIDHYTRRMVLETPKQEMIEFIAGPEVQNLSRISAGDHVIVEYLVAVGFEVRKPTPRELALAEKGAAAKAASTNNRLPAAGSALSQIRVATIESVNMDSKMVTLRGVVPDRSVEVKASDADNLSYVKAGDTVVISALEAVATSVRRVP